MLLWFSVCCAPQLMAVFGQSQSRPGMTAVYDAYSTSPEPNPQSKQQQQQHSNVHQTQYPHHHHVQQQQQHHQQQPWYDVSDGAVTPPDESASHRDSRMTGPTVSTRRIKCHVTAVAALEVFIIAVMATMEYLLRYKISRNTASCFLNASRALHFHFFHFHFHLFVFSIKKLRK